MHNNLIICIDNTRIYPLVRKVRPGTTTYFTCVSMVVNKWSHVGFNKSSNANKYAPTAYMIYNVQMNNIGIYECEGVTDSKHLFYAQATLKLLGKHCFVIL